MTAMLARAGQSLHSEVEMDPKVSDDLWNAYQYMFWELDLIAEEPNDRTAAALRVVCSDFANVITYSDAFELPDQPSKYLLNELGNLLSDGRVVLGTDVRRSGKFCVYACRHTSLTDDCHQ